MWNITIDFYTLSYAFGYVIDKALSEELAKHRSVDGLGFQNIESTRFLCKKMKINAKFYKMCFSLKCKYCYRSLKNSNYMCKILTSWRLKSYTPLLICN